MSVDHTRIVAGFQRLLEVGPRHFQHPELAAKGQNGQSLLIGHRPLIQTGADASPINEAKVHLPALGPRSCCIGPADHLAEVGMALAQGLPTAIQGLATLADDLANARLSLALPDFEFLGYRTGNLGIMT